MSVHATASPWRLLVPIAFGALVVSACSSGLPGSPAEPTAPAGGASATVTTATAPVGIGAQGDSPEPFATEGELVVSSLVAGTACPTLQFTVGTYTFSTTTSTRYTGGTCTGIHAGSRLGIVATRVTATGPNFVLSAVTFKTDTPTPTPTPTPNPYAPVHAEGTIASIISPSQCPALYFTLSDGRTFSTNPSTEYERGTCSSLRVGTRVSLTGTMRNDTVMMVIRAEFEVGTPTPSPSPRPTPTPTPTPTPAVPVSGEGTITSLVSGTACPTLQFSIGRYTISVDATTRYDAGVCSDLSVGTHVHVAGTVRTDGSIAATRVEVRSRGPEPIEGDGVVTGLTAGTSCPSLQFSIGSYRLTVDSATQYVGGSCADIMVGATVGVRGSRGADRSIAAARITFER